jgi:hypothetical protein
MVLEPVMCDRRRRQSCGLMQANQPRFTASRSQLSGSTVCHARDARFIIAKAGRRGECCLKIIGSSTLVELFPNTVNGNVNILNNNTPFGGGNTIAAI